MPVFLGTACSQLTWAAAAASLAFSFAVLFSGRDQHGFWVAFATLAVLRSSALNTGQSAVQALLGTAVGTDTAACWILLPLAVAFMAIAPAALSFAAGQAGFTFVLVLMFNIIAPTGWSIGAVRAEDMALGCGIGVTAGLLLWPQGRRRPQPRTVGSPRAVALLAAERARGSVEGWLGAGERPTWRPGSSAPPAGGPCGGRASSPGW